MADTITYIERSPIQEFYKGKNVLITGATGFMGKVLVEKLLRSCPDVGTLYLLIRPKKGQSAHMRLNNEVLNCKLFDRVFKSCGRARSKLRCVSGDITQPELGMSQQDLNEVLNNVSVVVHAAATVKFNDLLKVALEMNVTGTQRVVQLCKKMRQLDILVHVSTAYSNCDRKKIEELFYPPPCDPEDILATTRWMDCRALDVATPMIIGNRPNTYTYTKALAEYVIRREAKSLPVVIVRPSIVTGAWKEPVKGWSDNLNGPAGCMAAIGNGLLRTMNVDVTKVADLIPVDIAVNTIIAAAWFHANNSGEDAIYNCVSGSFNPVTWGMFEEYVITSIQTYPPSDVLWYPSSCVATLNSLHNALLVFLLQLLPAYLFDGCIWAMGRKPRLVSLVEKLKSKTESLHYFSTSEWNFQTNNMENLYAKMSCQDKKTFYLSLKSLNWKTYIKDYWLGIRKYIMKQSEDNIPEAKKNFRRKYWVHVLSKLALVFLVCRLLARRIGVQSVIGALIHKLVPLLLGAHIIIST